MGSSYPRDIDVSQGFRYARQYHLTGFLVDGVPQTDVDAQNRPLIHWCVYLHLLHILIYQLLGASTASI